MSTVKKEPSRARPAGTPASASAASQGSRLPPRPGAAARAGTKRKLFNSGTSAIDDGGSLLERRLQKVKDTISDGDETIADIYSGITEEIDDWLTLAKDLAADAARGKRQRTANSTDHTKAAEDFMIAQMKHTLRGITHDKVNMEVRTGAIIKRRGAEWTMLVWKGVGMFAPKRVAFWIREFFISAVLGSDLEVAWTMSSVRKFFRMEKFLTMYRITHEHYRHGTFIPARKQEAVLNRVDQNLRCGQPNAVSVHSILVRMGTVLELIGRDMRWKLAFTRSADELLQRDLELYDDDDALEAIIGPWTTWGCSLSDCDLNDMNNLNDDEILDL